MNEFENTKVTENEDTQDWNPDLMNEEEHEQKTYILHGYAEKVIHGKNGYCGIYVPIKRYQNGSFQTVWYLASFFNSNISVVKGDTVFLRGYRISDKSYNGFDYLDLTCSDIIGIHNL